MHIHTMAMYTEANKRTKRNKGLVYWGYTFPLKLFFNISV